MKTWLIVLSLCAEPLLAADGVDAAAQRARMARERAQADADYRAKEVRCRQQFSVTRCVEKARAERRAVVERLDHESAVLDDMERKRRAADRTRRIEEKLRAAESRSAPSTKPLPEPKPRREAASAPALPTESHGPLAVDPGAPAAYEKRLRDAQAHREAVERRNAERAARRKPAAPLPPSPAASR